MCSFTLCELSMLCGFWYVKIIIKCMFYVWIIIIQRALHNKRLAASNGSASSSINMQNDLHIGLKECLQKRLLCRQHNYRPYQLSVGTPFVQHVLQVWLRHCWLFSSKTSHCRSVTDQFLGVHTAICWCAMAEQWVHCDLFVLANATSPAVTMIRLKCEVIACLHWNWWFKTITTEVCEVVSHVR